MNWDHFYLDLCVRIAQRSKCLSRKCGACVVSNEVLVSMGYNGPPRRVPHCDSCLRAGIPSGTHHELCRGMHAEVNAILFGLQRGGLAGFTLYSLTSPCAQCAKIILQVGIVKVVYLELYPDKLGEALLREGGVELQMGVA